MKRAFVLLAALLASASVAHAAPKNWIAYKQPVIAFTHATVVDGTGAAPKVDQTLVVDKGHIAELGPAASTRVPAGATVIDARGKTLLPGFVMMHDYWAAEGVTSFKPYDHITRAELKAVIGAAHAHHDKVTGHLCSVTFREAAELGIDNLEHAFFVSSDFVKDKQPDKCPEDGAAAKSIAALDLDSPGVESLIKLLVAKRVALTSTLPVFATFIPGQREAPKAALALLDPALRNMYEDTWKKIQATPQPMAKGRQEYFAKSTRLEKRFVEAGGLLMGGSDPTGYGGVIPGFSAKREIELLVQADGFTFPQAIEIVSLNAAKFEGRDKDIGSLAVGKRADIVVIDGDPARDITAIEHMPLVFKNGVGYDTAAIFRSMQGQIGMN